MNRTIAAVVFAASIAGSGGAQAADLENTLYMDLTYGRVVIELRPDLAPKTVARMKELTRQHFFDGIVFHPKHRVAGQRDTNAAALFREQILKTKQVFAWTAEV